MLAFLPIARDRLLKTMMKTKRKDKKPATTETTEQATANERRARLLIVLLCVGLSALAVVPFFFMGQSENGGGGFDLRMPTTHDMFAHYDQMRSFYNGLTAGEVYPRWEEDTNRGFGAPTTSYYPPGIYYLTSACYFISRDWIRALLDAHLLMMIASAAALYVYARQVMERRAAMAAMAAYVFLPYHLADQYHRGAIAELIVFVWMPLMLLFGDRLMRAPVPDVSGGAVRRRSTLFSMVGLAISYSAFLWTHPPTAYQFTLGFGVYVFILGVLRREWKGMIAVGAAIALGIGLAAAYLLPAAIEQNLIHKDFIAETWPYHNTYIFVHDLYTANLHRGFFHLLDWIWISGTAIIAAGAITLLALKGTALKPGAALKQRVLMWVILGGLASFMMIKASMPIGKLIPRIEIGVFTWRMLAITTLVVALLAGAFAQAAIDAGRQRVRSTRIMFASFAGFVVVGGAVLSAIAVARPMISADVFQPELEHINYAMVPSTAPDDPEELPDDLPQAELAAEAGDVEVQVWNPEHRVIRANVNEDDELLVRTFNFPGWTASVDGQQTPIRTAEELGDMEIDLHAGAHLITLDFLETQPRRVCRLITIGSFAVLVVVSLAGIIVSKVGKQVL